MKKLISKHLYTRRNFTAFFLTLLTAFLPVAFLDGETKTDKEKEDDFINSIETKFATIIDKMKSEVYTKSDADAKFKQLSEEITEKLNPDKFKELTEKLTSISEEMKDVKEIQTEQGKSFAKGTGENVPKETDILTELTKAFEERGLIEDGKLKNPE